MILDTNALSAFIDGDRAVGRLLAGRAQVAIPVIVLGEFRYGVAGSRRRANCDEAWLDEYLPDFDVLAVSAETAVVYASLRVALKKKGQPIPANDAWIACAGARASLATTDPRRAL